MSFANENQPQEIESFKLNDKSYGIYEIPGCFDFLDLYQQDEDRYIEIDYPVMTAQIISHGHGARRVEFLINLDADHPIILQTIVTTEEKLLGDVTESFKKLLQP